MEKFPNSKRKRLSPEKLSPTRPVPSHIPRPPYITSKTPPGIASGLEVHDEKGIECMRNSGRLAAQVLEYAGTLVKVTSYFFHLNHIPFFFCRQNPFSILPHSHRAFENISLLFCSFNFSLLLCSCLPAFPLFVTLGTAKIIYRMLKFFTIF